jgi:uncharacterized protein
MPLAASVSTNSAPSKASIFRRSTDIDSGITKNQEMAYLLKNLRKTLPARDRRRLNAEQRSWRRHLVSCSKDPDCIADRYDQRIHQLLTVKCLDASRCAQW